MPKTRFFLGKIIEKRLKDKVGELQIDYIGLNSVFRNALLTSTKTNEIRLRIAVKAQTQAEAALAGEEVEALYTNGPAGGGGVRKYVNEIIGIVSVLVDRNLIKPEVILLESL